MGKKPRNADGSKKKKPEPEAIEETFEGNYLWELVMARGDHSELEYCTYCEKVVPMNVKSLSAHFQSKKHKNREALHALLPLFAAHGIMRWGGRKEFYCEEHGPLQAKTTFLVDHLKKHPKVVKAVEGGGEDDFKDHTIKVFKVKLWMVDLKSTNAGLNLQLLEYKKVRGPMTLREDCPSNSFVANLKKDIFTKTELKMMTKVASYLEAKGDNVNRSETIQGTKMCAFGMRWGMGDTGWYSHKHTSVYKLALEFCEFVFDRLQIHYPCAFQHLNKILKAEGFTNGEASLGRSPFTSFAVTRDYNVRPHIDQDDYDLGFIIWLQEDHVEDDEEVSLFAFPEFKVAFTPGNGDVICFRAGDSYHCTRALKKKNQLGLAFFQKASLLRHLKLLLDLPPDGFIEVKIPEKGKTPAKTIIEKKADFEKKKITYKKRLSLGKYHMSDL